MIFPLYMTRGDHVHGFDTSVEVFPVREDLATLVLVFRLSVALIFTCPREIEEMKCLKFRIEVQLILWDTQAFYYPSMSFIDGYSLEQRQQ